MTRETDEKVIRLHLMNEIERLQGQLNDLDMDSSDNLQTHSKPVSEAVHIICDQFTNKNHVFHELLSFDDIYYAVAKEHLTKSVAKLSTLILFDGRPQIELSETICSENLVSKTSNALIFLKNICPLISNEPYIEVLHTLMDNLYDE